MPSVVARGLQHLGDGMPESSVEEDSHAVAAIRTDWSARFAAAYRIA